MSIDYAHESVIDHPELFSKSVHRYLAQRGLDDKWTRAAKLQALSDLMDGQMDGQLSTAHGNPGYNPSWASEPVSLLPEFRSSYTPSLTDLQYETAESPASAWTPSPSWASGSMFEGLEPTLEPMDIPAYGSETPTYWNPPSNWGGPMLTPMLQSQGFELDGGYEDPQNCGYHRYY
jgi:hypothetical protein